MAYASRQEPTPARLMGRQVVVETVDGKTPERRPQATTSPSNKAAIIKDFVSLLLMIAGTVGVIVSLTFLLGPWGLVLGCSGTTVGVGLLMVITNE